MCCVPACTGSYPSQHSPNVLISIAGGHQVLPLEPVPCLEDLKLFVGKLWSTCWVEGSASAAGAYLLWSPVYLVPLLHPLSCFPLGGLFPSSSPSVAGKPTCPTVGTAIWRRRQCQMVQGIIYRPLCISSRVVLALSTILTHCSLQPPPALILLGVWFKAHKICSHQAWTLRQEQRWTQMMYAHALSRKSETSVGDTSPQWLLKCWCSPLQKVNHSAFGTLPIKLIMSHLTCLICFRLYQNKV